MPEILTESFCERCGTRYTFEAVAPKTRPFAKLKILSKGLRNYVLSDETSLDEAFADARSEEQRQVSGQQLEAFHKTFNFCLNCRQYTCSNCWNEAEGRCLTCAPNLSHEILPAAFPNLPSHPTFRPIAGQQRVDEGWPVEFAHPNGEPSPGLAPDAQNGRAPIIEASAWPTVDLRVPSPVEPVFEEPRPAEPSFEEPAPEPFSETAEPETAGVPEMAESDILARLRQLTASEEQQEPEAVANVPEPGAAAPERAMAAEVEPGPALAGVAEPVLEAATEAEPVLEAELAEEPLVIAEPLARVVEAEGAESAAPEAALALLMPEAEVAQAEIAQAEVAAEASPAHLPLAEPEPPAEAPELLEPEPVAAAEAHPEVVQPEPARHGPNLEDLAVAAVARTTSLFDRFRAGHGRDQERPEIAATAAPAGAEPAAPATARAENEQVAAPPLSAPVPTPTVQPPPPPSAPVWQVVAPDTPPAEPLRPAVTTGERAAVSGAQEPPWPSPASAPTAQEPTRAPAWPSPQPQRPTPGGIWEMPTPPPGAGPQWPATGAGPQWPPSVAPELPTSPATPSWPPAQGTPGRTAESLWVESSRSVLDRPGSGVQACVSCGLPLSATARFCRRCGSRQG